MICLSVLEKCLALCFEFCACVLCMCAVVCQMSIANRMMHWCICVLSVVDLDVGVLEVRITVYIV